MLYEVITPTVNAEQTLITAASMRESKYAQLRFYSLRALGEMDSLSESSIGKIIVIAARERDAAIKEEAIQTLSRIVITSYSIHYTKLYD